MNPLETLRYHVTGAIERKERQAIAGISSRKHFEQMTCGNVLAEVLKEVAMANDALSKGNSIGCKIHLDYVETIIDDACEQYGSSAVFGVIEIANFAK